MPDLFKDGVLNMSTEPLGPSGAPLLWGDSAVNHWAVILALVLFVLELSDLIRLYPHLLRCLSRWKGNLDLEHSVSLARTRNTIALVTGLVCCLIADRWELVNPSFKMRLNPELHLLLTSGMVAGTLILRQLLYLASKFRSRTSEYAQTLRHTLYNYLILLTSVMLLTVLLLVALRVEDSVIRMVLYVECIVFYLVHLIYTGQILRSRCGTLATILYLCALEILPFGILIFACTL
ncbi:MAG: DUF4271 domain-containing protein [Bacteroidales bacterium]|nr:DUF4271 domain-containing protein [Bacteroidales bacterium]